MMKKMIATLVATVVVMGSLVGCGSTKDTETTTKTTTETTVETETVVDDEVIVTHGINKTENTMLGEVAESVYEKGDCTGYFIDYGANYGFDAPYAITLFTNEGDVYMLCDNDGTPIESYTKIGDTWVRIN